MSCGPIRSSGRLTGACSRLFSSPLTLPGVVTTLRVRLPRAPALRQVLVAMLAEGALESPSVLVLAFHSSLFLVGGLSDGSSRWGHPVVSSLSQISIGTKTLCTFPSGWRQAFAMGSPVSGRVELFCALDRNEGFFRSTILRCFAMGVTLRVVCVFLTLDRNEVYFG